MRSNKFLKVLKMLVLCALAAFVFSYVTMSLWNWLIPELFNGPSISLLQAFGLLLLSKILFSGIGGNCNGKRRREIWKRKFQQRLSKMTPEEKARFKNRFRAKCFDNSDNIENPSKDQSAN